MTITKEQIEAIRERWAFMADPDWLDVLSAKASAQIKSDLDTLLQALDEANARIAELEEDLVRLSEQYKTELAVWSAEQERVRAEKDAEIAALQG